MILFRADANSSIGLSHVMRCLSIADALSSTPVSTILPRGKKDIKFILADESVEELIQSRGYESIVLHTDYKSMDGEIPVWEELSQSIDADAGYLLMTEPLRSSKQIFSYLKSGRIDTWLQDRSSSMPFSLSA